jgi:dTDP-4-dehydrorhamnose 3,5-epimerase
MPRELVEGPQGEGEAVGADRPADPPHGVRVVDLTTRADPRGAFTETFRQAWLPEDAPAMVQSNLSISRAGVLRGLHLHRRQSDFWCVIEGAAFVALVDLRRGSPSEGATWTETFDAAHGLRGLYVPPGVAHGFCALTDLRMQYMVDAYFSGEDEFGFAWNDPDLALPWPIEDPVVSDRDATAPSLAEVLADPPVFPG